MKRFLTFLGLIILCHSLVAQEKKEHATLSGYIKDFESGETLIGAAVYIESLKVGVTSNLYGFYSLSVPAGKYKVTISYLGYISNSEEFYRSDSCIYLLIEEFLSIYLFNSCIYLSIECPYLTIHRRLVYTYLSINSVYKEV